MYIQVLSNALFFLFMIMFQIVFFVCLSYFVYNIIIVALISIFLYVYLFSKDFCIALEPVGRHSLNSDVVKFN